MTAPLGPFAQPKTKGERLLLVEEQALHAAEVFVCIPARDEQALILRCMAALAPQLLPMRAAIVLVVNNTCDATAEIALAKAQEWRLPVVLWEGDIEKGGVGAARRLGTRLIRDLFPRCRLLLSTDADAVPSPGWIAAMVQALDRADAATGVVQPIAAEFDGMPEDFHRLTDLHERYLKLTEDFLSLADPAGASMGLNRASGANFGVRFAAYDSVGGYAPLAFHEDRDLHARLRSAGMRIVHAQQAIVHVSMRAEGRAPNGMSSGIALRLAGLPTADSALRPLSALLRHPFWHAGSAEPLPPPTFVETDLADLAGWVERLGRCRSDQDRLAMLRGC